MGHIHVVKADVKFISIEAFFSGKTVVKAGIDISNHNLTSGVKLEGGNGVFPISNFGSNFLILSTIYGGGNYNLTILKTLISNIHVKDDNDDDLFRFDYTTLNGNSFFVNETVDYVKVNVTLAYSGYSIYLSMNGDPLGDVKFTGIQDFTIRHGVNFLRVFNNATGVMYKIKIT